MRVPKSVWGLAKTQHCLGQQTKPSIDDTNGALHTHGVQHHYDHQSRCADSMMDSLRTCRGSWMQGWMVSILVNLIQRLLQMHAHRPLSTVRSPTLEHTRTRLTAIVQ